MTSTTPIINYACAACGKAEHIGGISACPNVKEVEFDLYGRVTRIVKK